MPRKKRKPLKSHTPTYREVRRETRPPHLRALQKEVNAVRRIARDIGRSAGYLITGKMPAPTKKEINHARRTVRRIKKRRP